MHPHARPLAAVLCAALALGLACRGPALGPADAGAEARPVVSGYECDVQAGTGCDAGASCFLYTLDDGRYGSRCFPGACDPVAQDCPGGQKCTYLHADGGTARACVAPGGRREGESCYALEGQDTCAAGLVCVARKAGVSVCARFCRDASHCGRDGGPDTECNAVLHSAETAERPQLCGPPSPRCDPLAQDCREAFQGCYPQADAGVCATAGALGVGERCTQHSTECAKGSVCVGTEGARTCRALCRLPSGEPSCASGTCRPLQGAPPEVGACVP